MAKILNVPGFFMQTHLLQYILIELVKTILVNL